MLGYPVRKGGLGIPSACSLAGANYLASQIQTHWDLDMPLCIDVAVISGTIQTIETRRQKKGESIREINSEGTRYHSAQDHSG